MPCSRAPQSCIEGGESAGHSLPPPTIPAGPETRTHNLWVTSPTHLPLGHNFHIIIIIIIIIYIYIYIQSISRHFYPKRLTNEDNRSNQNQQKSNKMQVLLQVIIVITTTTTMHVIKYSTEKYKNKS